MDWGHPMLVHSYNIQFIHNFHNGENMFVTFKYMSVLKDLIAKGNPCQLIKVPFIPLATVSMQKTPVSFQLAPVLAGFMMGMQH